MPNGKPRQPVLYKRRGPDGKPRYGVRDRNEELSSLSEQCQREGDNERFRWKGSVRSYSRSPEQLTRGVHGKQGRSGERFATRFEPDVGSSRGRGHQRDTQEQEVWGGDPGLDHWPEESICRGRGRGSSRSHPPWSADPDGRGSSPHRGSSCDRSLSDTALSPYVRDPVTQEWLPNQSHGVSIHQDTERKSESHKHGDELYGTFSDPASITEEISRGYRIEVVRPGDYDRGS